MNVWLYELFEKLELPHGRKLTKNKSEYLDTYPKDKVYFNAIIIASKWGKIWEGDIHIEKDESKLVQLGIELSSEIYVIEESKYFIGSEDLDAIILRSSWNSSSKNDVAQHELF